MEIMVCVKQVPGSSNVEVDKETGVLKRDGSDSKMNPYDLYAVETALKIKEQTGAKLKAISMGPPPAQEVLKETFMMGADEAYLITDRKFGGADVLATSYTIAGGIKKAGEGKLPDLIVCGKQTTDGDTAQVGPELSEFLGIPMVPNVTKIVEVKDASIVVEMDLGHCVEVVEMTYPCLITVEKGIYTPRLPSYKLQKATADKQIPWFTLNDFEDKDEKHYGLNGSPTQVKRIFNPEPNTDRETWEGTTDEVAEKLFQKLIDMKIV